MENKLEIFKNSEFGEVRTINENGKILFCGSDVAKALGYAIPSKAVNTHCRWVSKMESRVQTGVKKDGTPAIQNVEMLFITESDLYRLIANSKLESAQKFESWIFDEVLPAIRKTGGYVSNETLFIDTYLPYADESTKKLFSTTLEVVRNQNKMINEMKPKVLFADAVETADTSILVGDMSKILKQNGVEIGQNRLFQWLRENNYLIKNGERRNMPTQSSMDRGLFEVKERTINDSNGVTRITKTTKITGKGQIYFINQFISGKGGENL